MFSKFDDRYDETVFFISHNKDSLAELNYYVIREIITFLAVIYSVYISFSFIFVSSFHFFPAHFLPLLILAVFYRCEEMLEEHLRYNFERMRVFAFLFYISIMSGYFVLDAIVHPLGRTVVFSLWVMAFGALYIDYFFITLGFEAAFSAAFFLIEGYLKKGGVSSEAVFIVVTTVAVSMFCYGVTLGTQTDRGQTSDKLERKSRIDMLTGLLNKLSFEEDAREYLEKRPLKERSALLIIDFDNFKSVNDRYGHLVGDKILKKFGEILQSNFRATDIIGRVGGDEFMVLAPGNFPEGSIEQRCEIVEHELNVARIGDIGGFSCSIGVIEDSEGHSFEELYLLADDALYEAKARGKKQFIKWTARRIAHPPRKVVYIVSPDEEVKEKVAASFGENYFYIIKGEVSEALNEISLYQHFLDTVIMDYERLEVDESILKEYIESRPIFKKIPVVEIHDRGELETRDSQHEL